jgi:PAS domain S-box-containing protein
MPELSQLSTDILRQLPVGLVVWQLEDLNDFNTFKLIEINPIAREILGLSSQSELDVDADPFPGFLKIEMPGVYADVLSLDTVKDLGDVRYRDRFGVERIFALKAFPLKQQRIGVMMEDVSDRKRADTLLHEFEQRLVFHVQQTPLAFIEWNLSGQIVEWNPAAEQMFGYAKRDAIGQQATDLLYAPDQADHFNRVWSALMHRRGGRHSTSPNLTRSGRVIMCEWYNTPLVNEDGDIIGVVSLVEDVTQRHASEAALVAFAHRLEQSNRELEDFASVASHDLQAPLRKIQTFGDRLWAVCGDTLTDEGRDYLKRMQNASQRMQTLINDLLSFARVTTKAQPFSRVDLSTILQEVLLDLEVHIQQVKGYIEIGKLPVIQADPLQMRQLLQNLISNALKFHGAEPPHIQVSSQVLRDTNGQPQCQITVSDNGIGFEEKYCDRIFAVFQRLHGVDDYEGTGVGLAICRKIVERHGGTITATSKPGLGTTFIATLPICQCSSKT